MKFLLSTSKTQSRSRSRKQTRLRRLLKTILPCLRTARTTIALTLLSLPRKISGYAAKRSQRCSRRVKKSAMRSMYSSTSPNSESPILTSLRDRSAPRSERRSSGRENKERRLLHCNRNLKKLLIHPLKRRVVLPVQRLVNARRS